VLFDQCPHIGERGQDHDIRDGQGPRHKIFSLIIGVGGSLLLFNLQPV
jgi:hypothetical protein